MKLTLCQWDGDDHTVSSSYPKTISTDKKCRDSHKREAQLAGTYNRRDWTGYKNIHFTLKRRDLRVRKSECTLNMKLVTSNLLCQDKTQSHPASCWRMAQCPRPGGAGVYEHGRDAGWSRAGSTPTRRRRSTLAAAPGSLCGGGRRRTSAVRKKINHFINTKYYIMKSWSLRFICDSGFMAHLYLHALGLDDVDLVLVAAPHFIVDDGHAANGVMRPTKVH